MSLIISGTHQALSFKTYPDGANPSWWLDLDLNGQSIYRIGNVCGTCEAMFKNVNHATLPIAPSELSKQLKTGIKSISQEVINTVSKILPEGTYKIGLIRIRPELIYSSINPIYYKRPEYYWKNNDDLDLGCDYESEIILPIVPENQLDLKSIEQYQLALNANETPTALAFSYLDIRAVSGRASVLTYAHFLLDGHHKMMAASKANKPINLLSFFTTDKSFADKKTIEKLISIRYFDSV